jgi:hypothetical protein
LDKFRELAAFDSPALVVGQVEVEDVQFVSRHRIEESAHCSRVEKVARDIEEDTPPLKTREIADRDIPDDEGRPGRKKLQESLKAVEQAGSVGSADVGDGGRKIEGIFAFPSQPGSEREIDA